MTRRHALMQLLKHGPMTMAEMLEVTGWTYEQVKRTKEWLASKGLIRKARLFNGWYAP
jgi:predicted transcriptional regulator